MEKVIPQVQISAQKIHLKISINFTAFILSFRQPLVQSFNIVLPLES